METNMLIGTNFEAGTETEEPILNPRTGEVILNLPEASPAQIDRAVKSARAAFKTWSKTTPSARASMLLAIADEVESNLDDLAKLEALNCGKPINEVRNEEIPAVADCFRFFRRCRA